MSEPENREGEQVELALDAQTHIFLELRRQNLDLLKVAIELAGYAGSRAPLKGDESSQVLERVWRLYSEMYDWIDPEIDEEEE